VYKFGDALLAATTIESCIDTILTEDAHLLRVPGITVTGPYVKGGRTDHRYRRKSTIVGPDLHLCFPPDDGCRRL
jgi:hypothetical protein